MTTIEAIIAIVMISVFAGSFVLFIFVLDALFAVDVEVSNEHRNRLGKFSLIAFSIAILVVVFLWVKRSRQKAQGKALPNNFEFDSYSKHEK